MRAQSADSNMISGPPRRGPGRRYRWRLVGTHITTVLGRDATGQYWDELYNAEELQNLRLRADWVLEHRLPLRATGQVNAMGRVYEAVETLHLPLSANGDEINMILGA